MAVLCRTARLRGSRWLREQVAHAAASLWPSTVTWSGWSSLMTPSTPPSTRSTSVASVAVLSQRGPVEMRSTPDPRSGQPLGQEVAVDFATWRDRPRKARAAVARRPSVARHRPLTACRPVPAAPRATRGSSAARPCVSARARMVRRSGMAGRCSSDPRPHLTCRGPVAAPGSCGELGLRLFHQGAMASICAVLSLVRPRW